jgi:hypothetical protein
MRGFGIDPRLATKDIGDWQKAVLITPMHGQEVSIGIINQYQLRLLQFPLLPWILSARCFCRLVDVSCQGLIKQTRMFPTQLFLFHSRFWAS